MRAGIGDGHKAIAGLFLAHLRFHPFEKILLVNVGFERAPGFARNDAQCALKIQLCFDGFDLHGIGGIQHMQFRKAFDFSERHAQHFRAKAGSAHSQQQGMLETRLFHVFGNALEGIHVRELLFHNVQPAQPVAFVAAGPE